MTQPGTRRRATIAVWAAVTAAAALTGTAAPSSAEPTVRPVPGVSDGPAEPVDINADGVVVGTSYGPNYQGGQVFTWDGDASTALPLVDGYESASASAINDDGVIVGFAYNTTEEDGAVGVGWVWKDDAFTTIDVTDGFDASVPVDINNAGQILLLDSTPRDDENPATHDVSVLDAGVRRQLTGSIGDRNFAADMNESGLVVGSFGASDLDYTRAFRWRPGDDGVDLGTLGGEGSKATAINENGQVAGTADTADGQPHAFRWTEDGGMEDLQSFGATSDAEDINASGSVAGSVLLQSGGERAFLWTESDGMQTLGTLGGGYSRATHITDAGTVLGESLTPDGRWHAFAWTAATGMVDLGPEESASTAPVAVNPDGLAVGRSEPTFNDPATAVVWDTTEVDGVPSAPGAPRSVTAAAGDGSALVAWAAPESNGRLDIDSYKVTASPGGAVKTVSATTDGSQNSMTFDGLANDTTYTFTVTATNAAGEGVASAPTNPVTPRSGAVPPVLVVQDVDAPSGGSASTGGAPNESNPVTTSVDVPPGTSGGTLSIAQGSTDQTPPDGFSFFGQQVNITAPAATAEHPLTLTFMVDESLLGGTSPDDVQVFRTEGAGTPTPVPDCTNPGAADPDPCVTERGGQPGRYVQLTVLTSSASVWNFGASTSAAYPFRGFFLPVKNPPRVTKVKAGTKVPFRFSLGGNQGLGVLASDQPQSTRIRCSGAHRTIGKTSPARGTLSYRPTPERYVFQWRTAPWMAGTCRRFEMTLDDGSTHSALVRLTK